jgi:hypothetical protein
VSYRRPLMICRIALHPNGSRGRKLSEIGLGAYLGAGTQIKSNKSQPKNNYMRRDMAERKSAETWFYTIPINP